MPEALHVILFNFHNNPNQQNYYTYFIVDKPDKEN